MYFHLDEILVEKGQEVKKGDIVAKSGQAGRGTAAHLHLGACWNNRRINPELPMASPAKFPSVTD